MIRVLDSVIEPTENEREQLLQKGRSSGEPTSPLALTKYESTHSDRLSQGQSHDEPASSSRMPVVPTSRTKTKPENTIYSSGLYNTKHTSTVGLNGPPCSLSTLQHVFLVPFRERRAAPSKSQTTHCMFTYNETREKSANTNILSVPKPSLSVQKSPTSLLHETLAWLAYLLFDDFQ